EGEPFLGREMSHTRDYSEEIASTIDEEVRRLIEAAHDEAWEILVAYREVLDDLVLQLMDKETLSRDEVLRIFAPIKTRPSRGSYTGYGKRLPSDRPPVLTPKELALTAAPDGKDLPAAGNGQSGATGNLGSSAPPALGADDAMQGDPLCPSRSTSRGSSAPFGRSWSRSGRTRTGTGWQTLRRGSPAPTRNSSPGCPSTPRTCWAPCSTPTTTN